MIFGLQSINVLSPVGQFAARFLHMRLELFEGAFDFAQVESIPSCYFRDGVAPSVSLSKR